MPLAVRVKIRVITGVPEAGRVRRALSKAFIRPIKNYFTEVEGPHKTLAIKSAWDDSLLDILKAEEADVLRLSFSNGWKDDDLSFVEKLKNIYGIEVYSSKITNLKSLHFISDIGYLAFEIDLKKGL